MSIPVVALDETSPAGSQSIASGDNRIREFKTQNREVLEVDHNYPSSGQDVNAGSHKQVTLTDVKTVDPASGANKGFLYLKDVSAVVELFWEDESGNVVQLTSGGVSLGEFRAGDLMHSTLISAPSGWTDVSATYNNKFIRISSGTPLTTGGSDTHDHGAATGSHTLTENEMPTHSHSFPYAFSNVGAAGSGAVTRVGGSIAVGTAGGGVGHTHTVSSVNNIPAYIQLRMFQKN